MKKVFGKCYIKITKNNMFVTVLDIGTKNILAQGSAGYVKMHGPRKRMPYTGELLGRKIGEECLLLNCKEVEVYLTSFICKKVKGIIRGLTTKGINIKEFLIEPNIAHNGVRLRKSKRR